MLTPREVSEKTFDKTFGFGYRMDDVDAYLQQVAASMTELIEINADLEKKLEVLAEKLNEYREDEESLRTAILGAQKLGDSVIRESKTKAEIITRDATCKAEAMVNNARRKIEIEQQHLIRTQREVAGFKNRLLEMYKRHIELISMIPGYDEDEEAVQQEQAAETAVQTEASVEPEQPPEQTAEPVREAFAPHDEQEEEIPPAVEDDDDDEEADGEQQLDSPEKYFGITLEDDDDGYDDEEEFKAEPSKHGEMRFGEAFRIKHKSGQHKFRK